MTTCVTNPYAETTTTAGLYCSNGVNPYNTAATYKDNPYCTPFTTSTNPYATISKEYNSNSNHCTSINSVDGHLTTTCALSVSESNTSTSLLSHLTLCKTPIPPPIEITKLGSDACSDSLGPYSDLPKTDGMTDYVESYKTETHTTTASSCHTTGPASHKNADALQSVATPLLPSSTGATTVATLSAGINNAGSFQFLKTLSLSHVLCTISL